MTRTALAPARVRAGPLGEAHVALSEAAALEVTVARSGAAVVSDRLTPTVLRRRWRREGRRASAARLSVSGCAARLRAVPGGALMNMRHLRVAAIALSATVVLVVALGWLALLGFGLGVGACGEDGEIRGDAYRRVCEGDFSVISVSFYALAATAACALVAAAWAIAKRSLRPVLITAAAAVAACVLITTWYSLID